MRVIMSALVKDHVHQRTAYERLVEIYRTAWLCEEDRTGGISANGGKEEHAQTRHSSPKTIPGLKQPPNREPFQNPV